MPRKKPGNANTLLIWFGKSLRPVPTTAACRCACSGSTSGSGLARASTMPRGAMVAMSSPLSRFGAETPMKTSAPASPSRSVPEHPLALVFSAIQVL